MAEGLVGRLGHALGGGVHAGTVYLNVLPKLTDFEKVLTTQVEGASAAALTGLKSTAERQARVLAGAGKLLTVAITAPLIGLSAVAYQVFQNQQVLNRQTAAAIESTGGVAGVTSDHVEEMAISMARATGATNQYIQAGENVLLSFRNIQNVGDGVNAVFDRATAASLDLSARLGVDLNRAAQGVGRALQNPIDANVQLRRVGFALTQEERDKIKVFDEANNTLGAQKVVLDALETAFGGAAEAAATPMDHLRVSLELLAESWGEVVAPVFDAAIHMFTGLADAFTSLPKPIKEVAGAFATLLATVGPILLIVGKFSSWKTQMLLNFNLVKNGLLTMGTKITGVISAILGAFTGLGTAFNVGLGTGVKTLVGGLKGLGTTLLSFLGANGPLIAAAAGTYVLFEGFQQIQNSAAAAEEAVKSFAEEYAQGLISAQQIEQELIRKQVGKPGVFGYITQSLADLGNFITSGFSEAGFNQLSRSYSEFQADTVKNSAEMAVRALEVDTAISRLNERLVEGGVKLDYYRSRMKQLGVSQEEIAVNIAAANRLIDAQKQDFTISGKQLQVYTQTLDAVGLSFKDLNEAAQKLSEDGTTTMGDWIDFVKENMGKAKEAIDQAVGSIADSLVGPNNPFDKFADKTHFTTDRIKKAFTDWAKSAVGFGRDILKLQKASPEFAQKVLESGNTELAHFFATHKKFTDGIASQYDKTMGKVQTLAGTIAHALMPVLGDIREILLKIAKTWGVKVDLHDGATSKLEAIGARLRAYTSSPYYISVQVREGGTIPTGGPVKKKASGGWVSGRTLVGERGPELVSLPSGSYVHSASSTRRIMGGHDAGQTPVLIRGEFRMVDWQKGLGELIGELDWRDRHD